MAMDSFSWGDSIRATLGSCLPCIKPGHDSDNEHDQTRANRARGALSAREELERLLDEPMTDYEDVETMSLHSNVGRGGGKRSKKKPKTVPTKTVRVFGIDLFGRRTVPSATADVEDEEDEDENRNSQRRRPRTISTSTLDSDAAPLGDDAITDFTSRAKTRWTPTQTDEELAAEETLERRRFEKEMQRERRRERKETKRLAEMGAFSGIRNGNPGAELDVNSSEFEGFPGSGSGLPPSADEFGPFVGGSSTHVESPAHPEVMDSGMELRGDLSDDREEDADFGATAYTKKRRFGDGGASGSGSGSHTRSRSRTSASISADGDKGFTSRSNIESTIAGANGSVSTKGKSKLRSKSKSSKGSDKGDSSKVKQSKSSVTSSSAAPSLPSPPLLPSPGVKILAHDFDGVPGGLSTPSDHLNAISKSALPSPGLPSAGFPSTGFGNFKRTTSSGLKSGAGVALARRGD